MHSHSTAIAQAQQKHSHSIGTVAVAVTAQPRHSQRTCAAHKQMSTCTVALLRHRWCKRITRVTRVAACGPHPLHSESFLASDAITLPTPPQHQTVQVHCQHTANNTNNEVESGTPSGCKHQSASDGHGRHIKQSMVQRTCGAASSAGTRARKKSSKLKPKPRTPGGAHSLAKDRGVRHDVGHLHHRRDHRCVPSILIKTPPACRGRDSASTGAATP